MFVYLGFKLGLSDALLIGNLRMWRLHDRKFIVSSNTELAGYPAAGYPANFLPDIHFLLII